MAKPRKYPFGTARTTGKRKVLFTHFAGNHTNILLYRKGLHQFIESWMLENPGKRLPKKVIIENFGCSKSVIEGIAKQVEKAHSLKARKRGGPNSAITEKQKAIMRRFYSNAAKQKTREVDIWAVLKTIARETGTALHPRTVSRWIEKLEKKHGKGIKYSWASISFSTTYNEVMIRLEKEGISARRLKGNKIKPEPDEVTSKPPRIAPKEKF